MNHYDDVATNYIELHNKHKYITPELLLKCIRIGLITHIDKLLCGNGLTSAFMKLIPKDQKIHLLIAPTRAVVESKEYSYEHKEDIETRFIYGKSKDKSVNGADIVMTTTDSFIARSKEYSDNVDLILIDEWHSVGQGSLYRPLLVEFIGKVRKAFPKASILTATATPNMFSEVNVLIRNDYLKPVHINLSNNRNNSLERIKASKKKVIFTNSNAVIYRMRDKNNTVEANFVVGKQFLRSASEKYIIKHNPESLTTICSSAGYEGHDLHYDDCDVFVFDDRNKSFEKLFISNLYQGIHRNREKVSYVEYCRIEATNVKRIFSNIDEQIREFIASNKYSAEYKMSRNSQRKFKGLQFTEYHNFILQKFTDDGVMTLEANRIAIQLYREEELFDRLDWQEHFKEFIEARQITFTRISENSCNTKNMRLSESVKVANLLANHIIIHKHELFGSEYWLTIPYLDNRKAYIKHVKEYFRRKNFRNDYELSSREYGALQILENESVFKEVVYEYNQGKYKQETEIDICMLICMFVNRRIFASAKWTANRDYNLVTKMGFSKIEIMSEIFNTDVIELDVSSCYPRIIYAMCGLRLPQGFYGVDKVNKDSIVTLFNNFYYRSELKSTKVQQLSNTKAMFNKYGIDERVSKWLIDNYFDSPYRDVLFNLSSFHEKQLISKVKKMFQNQSNDGVIRRHDSVIIFNNKNEISTLNDFEFLGLKGWFEVEENYKLGLTNIA